jgi:hypothetical protein
MCKLIDMSEDFKQTEIIHGHQLLLNDFNAFHTLDFFLAYPDNSVLNIVAQLYKTVMLGVLILLLGRQVMLLGQVSSWTNHLLEVNEA